jgi:hypothetical protein
MALPSKSAPSTCTGRLQRAANAILITVLKDAHLSDGRGEISPTVFITTRTRSESDLFLSTRP